MNRSLSDDTSAVDNFCDRRRRRTSDCPSLDEYDRSANAIGTSTSSERLTPRQTDVLRLVREGQTNKQIANTLGIAEATVKVHCTAIFRALAVRNRTQAARS